MHSISWGTPRTWRDRSLAYTGEMRRTNSACRVALNSQASTFAQTPIAELDVDTLCERPEIANALKLTHVSTVDN